MNVTADGNCKRRRAAPAQCHSKFAVSVPSTAWMERRRPALPEESSERARGVLWAKRIKSLGKKKHIIYDLKNLFNIEEVDLRL